MRIQTLPKHAPLKLTLAVAALMSLTACADTVMPSSTPMHLGAAAFAPQGYIRFCERRPDQCGLPTPIAERDRAQLERALNGQQWANVFNLQPTSITPPAIVSEPPTVEHSVSTASIASLEETLQPLELSMPIVDIQFIDPSSAAPPSSPDAVTKNSTPPLFPLAPQRSAPFIHLTPLVWAALTGVNQTINDKIKPMSDEQAFGTADYWTLPLTDGPRPVGNCKHYALEKRKALVDAGFSADALSIAIVKTGWGEIHAVLVVGTDKGDYVLDNLSPWIKGWQDVRYTWIERQTPGQPLRWAAIASDQDHKAS